MKNGLRLWSAIAVLGVSVLAFTSGCEFLNALFPTLINEAPVPVVRGGTAFTVAVNATLSLNAAGSTDADNDALSFQWSVTAHPSSATSADFQLRNATTAIAEFEAAKAGDYIVLLKVSDGSETTSLTLTVTVTPPPAPRLSALAVSAGALQPAFSPDVFAYEVRVTAASITVTPTAAAASTSIAVNGSAVASGSASEAIALTVDASTTVTVALTGSGGGAQSYVIAAHRDPVVSWTLMDTSSVMNQHSAAMVYDPDRNVLVMFGGRRDSPAIASLDETWECAIVQTSYQWTLKTTSHAPPARFNPGMAYDGDRKRIVLFGGRDAAEIDLGDTWEYDGTDWTQVATVSAPSARSAFAMAYDGYRKKTVLTGGSMSADTWEYDGANWSRIITAIVPDGVGLPAMVYDAVRRKIVKFGGNSPTQNVDLWEYDALGWTRIATAVHPSYRWGHGMAYNSVRHRVVLFGGYAGPYPQGSESSETWEYDGTDWVAMAPSASPGAMEQFGMAYDPVQDCVVLTGYGQSWQYRAFP